MTDLGLPFAPAGVPGRVPLARRHRAGCPRPCDRLGLRTAAARQGPRAPTRRRSRASCSSSTTPTPKGLPLLDLVRPARAAHLPRLRRRQARARGDRRAVGRRRWACCCARSSGSRRAAGPSSSASRSSRSPTSCAPRPTAAASSPASSSPLCKSSPRCGRPRCSGCVAELFESLPEAGDLPKPKLVVFLDEAHLLFADSTKAFREVGRPHRAADPLQGRRRLLRHPAADGHPRRRCSASSAPRPARAEERGTVSTFTPSGLDWPPGRVSTRSARSFLGRTGYHGATRREGPDGPSRRSAGSGRP